MSLVAIRGPARADVLGQAGPVTSKFIETAGFRAYDRARMMPRPNGRGTSQAQNW